MNDQQKLETQNNQLSAKLADRGARETSLSLQSRLDAWKMQHFEKLAALAKDRAQAERIYVICMNTISKNRALLECTPESLTSCILQSFQLNLYPGPFSECAYVPLNNRKNGKKESNFWPQYQGLAKLMINAGNKVVIARVVRVGDHFEYHEGDRAPDYAPAVVCGNQRGERLFAYAAVCTVHGMWQVEVMSPEQIATIKARSPGAKTGDSPWNSKYDDDVDAMWAKCPLRRVSKWCSKSPELVRAIELDNEVDGDEELQKPRLVELVSNPVPPPQDDDEPLGFGPGSQEEQEQ